MEDLVDRLRDILGARLVAYLAAEEDAEVLNAWIAGTASPSDGVTARLRAAFAAAAMLREVEGRATVQSWFQGRDRQLSGAAPAQLLRDGALEDVAWRVEGAAQAAVSAG